MDHEDEGDEDCEHEEEEKSDSIIHHLTTHNSIVFNVHVLERL